MRQSIERNPDAIILAAADSPEMAELKDLATGNGIAVVAVDSPFSKDKRAIYVGSDNYELGITLAKEVKSRFVGGAIAIISYIEESNAAIEREAGFLDEMLRSPEFSIIKTVYCDSNPETAKEQTLKLIVYDNASLIAVACLNEQAVSGAGMAIEETGRLDVFLAGIGCSSDGARYMELGVLDVTLLQNPFAMGYYSVEAAVRNIRSEQNEGVIYTDFRVITKENMFLEENQRLIFPLS
jgi:ribose transport system substrate-binding protein